MSLFLSLWSTGFYGVWMALSAAVACFSVRDLGMSAAAGNAMIAAYARDGLVKHRHALAGEQRLFVLRKAFKAEATMFLHSVQKNVSRLAKAAA